VRGKNIIFRVGRRDIYPDRYVYRGGQSYFYSDEALSNESLLKSNADEAFNKE
jgi:hypothetical protein